MPGLTGGAVRCSTTSSRMRCAFSSQVHFGDVLPTGGGLRGRVIARARDVVLAIHGGGIHVAIDLQDELLEAGAFGGGEVFVLAAQAEGGVAAEDLGAFPGLCGDAAQQVELFGHGDGEGVAFVRRFPAVAICLDGRKLHGLGLDGGVGRGDDDGFAGDARDFLAGDDGRGSEAPRAVDDHAHAEAEAGILGDIGHGERLAGAALRREPHAEALIADAHNANVGVGGFVLLRLGKRDGAELFEFRVRSFGILGSGEETRGQSGGRGGKEMPACQHLGIVTEAFG